MTLVILPKMDVSSSSSYLV